MSISPRRATIWRCARSQPDSGLVARKLEDADLLIVAAPDYLKRHGVPKSVDQLDTHECIHFALPRTGQIVPWLLRQNGRDIEWLAKGAIRCADDIIGPVTLARHGAGVTQTYRFMVEQDLKAKTLWEVLPQYAGASRPSRCCIRPTGICRGGCGCWSIF